MVRRGRLYNRVEATASAANRAQTLVKRKLFWADSHTGTPIVPRLCLGSKVPRDRFMLHITTSCLGGAPHTLRVWTTTIAWFLT
jgi:hypothetical protein